MHSCVGLIGSLRWFQGKIVLQIASSTRARKRGEHMNENIPSSIPFKSPGWQCTHPGLREATCSRAYHHTVRCQPRRFYAVVFFPSFFLRLLFWRCCLDVRYTTAYFDGCKRCRRVAPNTPQISFAASFVFHVNFLSISLPLLHPSPLLHKVTSTVQSPGRLPLKGCR